MLRFQGFGIRASQLVLKGECWSVYGHEREEYTGIYGNYLVQSARVGLRRQKSGVR